MISPARRTVRSQHLVGLPVENLRDEHLGCIDELMIDVVSGRVAYAVLRPGLGESTAAKRFVIPWSSMQIDAKGPCLRLDVDAEKLKSAPGLLEDDWTDTLGAESLEAEWHESVHRFYGSKPYWESPEHYTA